MTTNYIKFINELCSLPAETEWFEFKHNHQPPEKIGEYISALSNSAALHQRAEAFLIFGIDNITHEVVGTTFKPQKAKGKGNYDLKPWLYDNIKPHHDFNIKEIKYNDQDLVLFFIKPALNGPIKFLNKKWIRIGSNNKILDHYPEKEAIIWERRTPFEKRLAKEDVTEEEILKLLDYDQYYRMTDNVLPKNTSSILDKFLEEEFLVKRKGKIHITNLGAISFAQNIENFSNIKNKSIRIITYKGINKLDAIKDVSITKGYATGFNGVIEYIKSQIPEVELIEGSLRKTQKTYPEKAIREFVANMLVHQDFAVASMNPFVEIYSNRIEIYNPGLPLISTLRFMDTEPCSRNEKLTDSLRRMDICEKRGSGVDRAIFAIELMQLPAPKIEKNNNGVKVTIYAYKNLNELTKDEKIMACYFHSQIKHLIEHKAMTNSSFCERLNIETKNQSIASRIIKDTLEKGLIKKFDPDNKSTRYVKYLPFYAYFLLDRLFL